MQKLFLVALFCVTTFTFNLFGQGAPVPAAKDSITPPTEVFVRVSKPDGKDTVIRQMLPGDHVDVGGTLVVTPAPKVAATPDRNEYPYTVTVSFYDRTKADSFALKTGGYVTEQLISKSVAKPSREDSLLMNGKGIIFLTPVVDTPVTKTVAIPVPVKRPESEVKTPTTFMAIAQEGGREVQPKIIPQTGDRPLHGYVVGQHVSLATKEYPIGYELLPTSQGGGMFLGRIIYYKKEIADSLAETKGMTAVDFLHNPKQVWETLPYQGTQGWRIQILTVTSEPYLISEGVFFFKDASVNKWYGYLTSFFGDKASADVALIKVRELYPDAFVRTSRW